MRKSATQRPEGRPAPESQVWRIRGGVLGLDRPRIMGVLNVTPDSFSDGGRHLAPEAAADRAREMAEEGADLVDVGGESTRPGATPVPVEEEWARVGPVLERLGDLSVPLSVDTRKHQVARRALEAGASVVNDVSGLSYDPEVAEVVAEYGAGLVLMHMRGTPETMQRDTDYDDLLGEVRDALRRALDRAVAAGVEREGIVVDPGIGFGKSAEGSRALVAGLGRLAALGRPILVGPSRKSFIGDTLEVGVEERLEGTLSACVVAYERGARIFRVHDVREARRALDLAAAVRASGAREGVTSGDPAANGNGRNGDGR